MKGSSGIRINRKMEKWQRQRTFKRATVYYIAGVGRLRLCGYCSRFVLVPHLPVDRRPLASWRSLPPPGRQGLAHTGSGSLHTDLVEPAPFCPRLSLEHSCDALCGSPDRGAALIDVGYITTQSGCSWMRVRVYDKKVRGKAGYDEDTNSHPALVGLMYVVQEPLTAEQA